MWMLRMTVVCHPDQRGGIYAWNDDYGMNVYPYDSQRVGACSEVPRLRFQDDSGAVN